MSKALSEQKVLNKLGIEDFRHLTKDKVMVMASLLDKMDPEVAMKALEQFPNFANTMKELFKDNKEFLAYGMKENSDSVNSYYVTCDEIISSCQKMLETENISIEDKRYILDKMVDIANMKKEMDLENKKFIIKICALGVTAIGVTTTALLTALGGNAKIDLDDMKQIS